MRSASRPVVCSPLAPRSNAAARFALTPAKWRSARASICAAALLLFSVGGAAAQDDLTFEPIRVADDAQSKSELDEALKAYKKNDFLRASMVLHRITKRSESAITPVEQKAEYSLGKTLYRLGLFQASVTTFDRIVQAGPEHRYFRATCKWMYYLSRKLSGDPALLEKIARYKPQDCPAEFSSELAFLIGQHHYTRGQVEQAQDFFRQVGPDSRYFPKAKFLEGISYVRLDQPKPAAESFKDLLRVTVTAKELTEDLKYFNQLAILSMARVFFSINDFNTSVKYYDQVPLESRLWLDALFESSWAFFRLNNHEKALGNLHTLNSPFFRDEYVPEGPILKAVIFFANCNYERTRETIDEFRVTYEPLKQEIEGYLQSFADPTELYEYLNKLQNAGSAVSPRVGQILNAAFQDKQLKRINTYVRELDREMDLIRRSKSVWAKSPLALEIIQDTEIVKSLAVDSAGRLAKQRLQRVVAELDDLIGQALRIQIEIATAEKGLFENKLRGAGFVNKPQQDGPRYATDDEHIYWPFTGEYWRDELGYYLYTIKSECSR